MTHNFNQKIFYIYIIIIINILLNILKNYQYIILLNYREQVLKLIDNQSAYYCFCTENRLELLRKQAIKSGQVPKYDNRCRNLNSNEVKVKLNNGDPFCIRFKV